MHIFTSEIENLYFHKWKYKTYIITPLSSEKYKIWIYFFLIYINVFITRDENFYGIHWKRVNFLLFYFYTPMHVSDVISNVTKHNKTWTSWRQGTKLRVRLSLANARFASLLSKVMYIIKRKFKCLSWIWLLFHLLKWKNVYSALMKYTCFHFTRWNKSHIHSKHLNILYLLVFMEK